MQTYIPKKLSVSLKHQSGSVLILAIIMALVLSVSAITLTNVNSVNQQLVRNQIETMRAEALANEVIERMLSSLTEFQIASAKQERGEIHEITDGRFNRDDMIAEVHNMRCTYSENRYGDGMTKTQGSVAAPRTNFIEFDVEVTSSNSGVSVNMTQGLRVTFAAGILCP